MSSLLQVAAASTLPPVDEHANNSDLGPPDERDDDPDLDPSDDSSELTQSEAETNVFQPKVYPSQETSSPDHEPDAGAGAGDVRAPPLGPPSDGPAQVSLSLLLNVLDADGTSVGSRSWKSRTRSTGETIKNFCISKDFFEMPRNVWRPPTSESPLRPARSLPTSRIRQLSWRLSFKTSQTRSRTCAA